MIGLSIDADSTIEESLENLDETISPAGLTAFLTTFMGPELARRAENRFANEGDDAVGAWAPLAPSTIGYWRPSQGYPSDPINYRSGELYRWVTQSGWDAVPTGDGAILRFPGSTPSSGTLFKKVQVAQFGMEDPRTPARPVLGLSTADLAIFAAGLAMHVSKERAL